MSGRAWMIVVLASVALTCAAFGVIGCSSSSSGPGDEDPADVFDIPGLVAFYEFDGDLSDASGGGHNGRSEFRMHYIADHNGTAESAVYLDDSDSFDVPDHDDLDFTGAFSVSAWILADLEDMAYCCFADKGYADEGWSIGTCGTLVPALKPLCLYVGTHTHSMYVTDVVPVGQDTWVHLVCCFNDTTDTATFYVDGAYAHTFTATAPVTLSATAYDLKIGKSHWNDQYCGGIDQLGKGLDAQGQAVDSGLAQFT